MIVVNRSVASVCAAKRSQAALDALLLVTRGDHDDRFYAPSGPLGDESHAALVLLVGLMGEHADNPPVAPVPGDEACPRARARTS